MKLKFTAHRGTRVKHNFCGMEDCDTYTWWWRKETREWVQDIDRNYSHSSHAPCKSVRAFRRMLKDAPKGVKFKLCSNWIGYDVYGTGSSTF